MTTLVLFPGALGDAVCAEPAVNHLARSGRVEFVARGGAAEVARLFPSQPAVRSLDDARVAGLFRPKADDPDFPACWLADYARVVSFTGMSSADLRARAGVRTSLTPETEAP